MRVKKGGRSLFHLLCIPFRPSGRFYLGPVTGPNPKADLRFAFRALPERERETVPPFPPQKIAISPLQLVAPKARRLLP
jgi:hypothetical protein